MIVAVLAHQGKATAQEVRPWSDAIPSVSLAGYAVPIRRAGPRSLLTQNPEMLRPAGRAGHEHPAKPGNGDVLTTSTIP